MLRVIIRALFRSTRYKYFHSIFKTIPVNKKI